jgi:hypothetical protein
VYCIVTRIIGLKVVNVDLLFDDTSSGPIRFDECVRFGGHLGDSIRTIVVLERQLRGQTGLSHEFRQTNVSSTLEVFSRRLLS